MINYNFYTKKILLFFVFIFFIYLCNIIKCYIPPKNMQHWTDNGINMKCILIETKSNILNIY